MIKNLVAQRLASHGLLTPKDHVLASLRQTVGIQAQAQKEAELNLALRTMDLTKGELTALYQEYKIVRSWANRWTLHLLTYEDWELLVNARQNERLPKGYYQGQKNLAERILPFIKNELCMKKRVSKSELAKLVAYEFPEFSFKGYCFNAIIQQMTQQGIAFVEANSSQRDHVLVYVEHFKRVPVEAAIQELIQRYLIGFAPAKLEDFTKWAGLKMTTVRPIWKAMNVDEAEDISTDVKEKIRNQTFIAARFDSLLTGYSDKTWLTPADKISEMWTKNGFLLAPVIFDGQLIGRWSYSISDEHIDFLVEHWLPFDEEQFSEKASVVARFLNKEIRQTKARLI